MRAIFPWLLVPLLSMPLAADEAALPRDRVVTLGEEASFQEVTSVPWVGLGVAKLDDMMRAHAPGVPEGVGFLVKSIASDGPAKTAGLRRYDVLWKFDDQLLVNEAQFATLLGLRKIGDGVKLSIVRSGKPLELDLVLAATPDRASVSGILPADLPLIPSGVPGMPQVRVTPHDRIAELSRADGSSAKLFYKGEEAYITIMDADQKEVYHGPVREEGKFKVPDEWTKSVCAMQRSLYKAKNSDWMPRDPRRRVVMPSNQDQH